MMPSIAYRSAGPARRRQLAFRLLTAKEPISPIECWAISVDRAGYVRRHTRPLALAPIQPGHIHYLPCRTVAAMDKDHGDPVEIVRFTGKDGLC